MDIGAGGRDTGNRFLQSRFRIPVLAGVVTASLIGLQPVPAHAVGNTRYVSSGSSACSDTGPGTQAVPYCTIAKGLGATLGGDTLLVQPGTYTGGGTLGAWGSGTPGTPTTIRSATPRGAILSGSATAGITLNGVHDVVVEGFRIDESTKEGIGVYSSQDVTVRNNEISRAGTPVMGSIANGILLSGVTSSLVSGNHLHDNANDGIALVTSSAAAGSVKSSGNTVSGNLSEGNAREYIRNATGILVTGDSNILTGNTVRNNEDTGIQVSAAGATASPASGNIVRSNVAYDNGDHGIDMSQAPNTSILGNSVYRNEASGIQAESNSVSLTLVNNISADNALATDRSKGQIRVDASTTSTATVNSNVVYNSDGGPLYTWGSTEYSSRSSFQAASGQGSNDIAANPRWVNAAGGDFHLTAGSPAIDTADTTVPHWPACDMKNVCPHNDRGALEFKATVPAAPTAVTAVPGDGTATIAWTAPSNGGSAVTSYEITASPGGATATVPGSATSGMVSGLTNATAYTFKVTATNLIGTGQSSAASPAVTPRSPQFTPQTPRRVLDTRIGIGASQAKVGPGESVTLAIPGLPATATAVTMNVTATAPTAASWLTVYPTGQTRPNTSNLNYVQGQTRPNLVTVAVGPGKQVTLYNAAGAVDVIADLAGYYVPAVGSGLTAQTPKRILDTRSGTGAAQAKVGHDGSVTLNIPGLPDNATAVTMNVTATGPTASSWLTVYPAGQARPNTSNLNYVQGQTTANLVTVAVGPGKQVTLYNAAGAVDLIADLAAYYAPAAGSGLRAQAPKRILDTRTGTGTAQAKIGHNASVTLTIPGLPDNATAVTMNLTATSATAPSWLTVYPTGQIKPNTSNLNYVQGQTTANLVVVGVSPGKQVTLYNAAGAVDVIADLAGYYAP